MEKPAEEPKLSALSKAHPDQIPLTTSAGFKSAAKRTGETQVTLDSSSPSKKPRTASEGDNSTVDIPQSHPPTGSPGSSPSRSNLPGPSTKTNSVPPPEENSWAIPTLPTTSMEHQNALGGPLPTQRVLVFPLPYSRPLSLPGHVQFEEPQIQPCPEISFHVSPLVSETIKLILADIQRWKELYNLFRLASLVRQAESYVNFETPSKNDMSGQTLFANCLWPYSNIVSSLHRAFLSSRSFHTRLSMVSAWLPSRSLPYLLDTLRLIQRDRVILRIALRDIIFPFYHWVSRPSSHLTKVLEHIATQKVPDNYSSGILHSRSVQRLFPGTWVDDDVINYFSGNRSGQHLLILGDGEVLFCSPLFWLSLLMKHRSSTLHDIHWDDAVLNIYTMSKIKRILVPIHYHQNHWILGHCNLRDLIVEIYDTLSSSRPAEPQYDEEVNVLKSWLSLLRTRLKTAYPSLESERWTIKAPMTDIPEQGTTNDCGVYVIMFARHLLTGFELNHDKLHRMEKIGRRWRYYNVGRLRLWMELPKSLGQWESIPCVLRDFPSYLHYAGNDLPI